MSVALAHGLRVAFSRFVTIVMTLVLLGALVLVWAKVVSTLTAHVEPKPAIGQPRAVVWQSRVFTTEGAASTLPPRQGSLVHPVGQPPSRSLRRSPG